MKVLIALSMLIGVSWALIPGTEYRYRYEGRIGFGIPEIRNKYSGAGIKATVIVQVFENKKVIFKFNNVEVGEFIGGNGIKVINPLPIKYVPLKEESRILEEPFEVNFNNYQNEELVVPKSDIEWIVNIRKSVTHLFLNEPIRGNFGFSKFLNSREVLVNAFTLYEPTVFGTCSLDYTLVPVGVTTDDINMKHISMNKEEEVYMLTKTINFDKCKDKVSLLFGDEDKIKNFTNTLYGYLSTRSSVTTMKVIGKPGHFVIYNGNVNGFLSVRPFGVAHDKMMYYTNVTFTLETRNKITNKLVVPTPTRVIKTIYAEVWSPFKAPANPVSFINYNNVKNAFYNPITEFNIFTGIPFEKRGMNYKNLLNDLIHEAAQMTLSVTPVTNMKEGSVNREKSITTILEKATYATMMVDITNLEALFETYYNDKSELGQMKLKLFIDICATSGYYPVKVVLNEITKGRITPAKITSIFSTFANTFEAAPLLKDIMSYVKTLDFKRNPVMTSNVIINFATILRKNCVERVQGVREFLGAERCDLRIVTEEFIPLLKRMFTTSTETFERRSIVRAMSNLKMVEAVKFIMEVVTGDYDVEVREFAILGLHYNNVKNVQRDDIFNVLMPIVHNIREDSYLRQIAITVLTTYRPSPTWWQRLALSTWREPSRSVGSFIYHMIKGYSHNTNPEYAEEEKICKFLLPLTKPYSSSSSMSYIYGRYNPEKYYRVLYETDIYKDDVMTRPRNVHSKLIYDAGDYTFSLFETMFMRKPHKTTTKTSNNHWSNVFAEKLKNIDNMSPDVQIVKDIYSEMMKMMNQDMNMMTSSNVDSVFVTFFENLQFMLPNLNTFKEKFDLFGMLMRGTNLGLTKFFYPMFCEMYLPTEMGLPAYMTFSAPIFLSAEGDVKLHMGEDTQKMNLLNPYLELNTNFKFESRFTGVVQTFTPWNAKAVKSGFETVKHLNLPVRIKTTVDYNGNFKNISFELTPTHNKEFTGVSISNVPFVGISEVYPKLTTNNEVFEVISKDGQGRGLYKNDVAFNREYTGIDATIRHRGDIPLPFTYANLYYYFNNPSMLINNIMSTTAKFFKTKIVFNFGTSETKVVHPSIAFRTFSMEDTNMIHKKKTTGEESSFVMSLLLKGTKSRYFETDFNTKVLSRDANTKRVEYSYRYVEHLPGMKPRVVCFNFDTKTPNFMDYKTLLKLLSANIDYTFVGTFRGGDSCKDAQFATLKGSWKVSNEMKNILIDRITKEVNINKYSKIEENFNHMSIYDRIHTLVEYKEPLPPYFVNMTYHMYDVLRGSQFPYLYTNYYNVKNPKGRISVEGERYLDGSYNLRVELPTENVNVERFEVPFVYRFIMNFFDYKTIKQIPILGLFNEIF